MLRMLGLGLGWATGQALTRRGLLGNIAARCKLIPSGDLMKSSLERPLRAGDDFWLVIERCLVEFHGWKPDQARKRADQFQVDLAPVRAANEEDLILHDEPFE